ncbi:MAG: histone deacetylase [Planctomycetes bacterium]|nr:histone deacetylase [Planctomycetota bacterium]
MKPILFYDDIFLEHDTGHHPENAERLVSIREHLKKQGLWENVRTGPRAATEQEIGANHEARYIAHCRKVAAGGGGMLDPDTVVSPRSYDAAVHAAGALLDAVDAVMGGKVESAVCLVRPPGHHALPAQGMGFCLFNNVAIAAHYLKQKYNLKKIAIVDWDVHHGNGTQDAFYRDPAVLFFSIHRYPFYPGTGAATETGEGEGKGATINKPVPYGISRAEYVSIFEDVLNGPVKEFGPEFVLISAGFDAHVNDPIAGLSLEDEDFGALTRIVKQVAEGTCGGKIVATLEGGYGLGDLPKCVAAHITSLGS